jgi:hypothetical protein
MLVPICRQPSTINPHSQALPYIQLEIERAMVFSGWRQGNYSMVAGGE